jgi:fumarate reductase (CoM/CoB) subunit A
LTRALEKWQPNQFHYLRDMGFDLRETLVEVAPHAHYSLGGVAIDEEARTTVPGLFAAGEAAGNLHGANRVSGNALAETQVFGALAGASAAGWAKSRGLETVPLPGEKMEGVESLLKAWAQKKEKGIRPHEVRENLRRVMWENCGVERDARGLEGGMKKLEEVEDEILPCLTIGERSPDGSFGAYPQELLEALEVRMMIELGKLVLASALFRKETRGHHMRQDFPLPSGEPRHTLVAKGKDPWPREVNRSGAGR